MLTKKISALPEFLSGLTLQDIFVIVNGGATKKITFENFLESISDQLDLGAPLFISDTEPTGKPNGSFWFKAPNLLYVKNAEGAYVQVAGTGGNGTVADDSITFAKLQNLAALTLIGRLTNGEGNPESITLGEGFDIDLTTKTLSVNSPPAINPTSASYDLPYFVVDRPSAGQTVLQLPIVTVFSLPINLVGSIARCTVASTLSVAFDIRYKPFDGPEVSIGSINFAAGSLNGTFTFTAAKLFRLDDEIRIVAPSVQDATLAGVRCALNGQANSSAGGKIVLDIATLDLDHVFTETQTEAKTLEIIGEYSGGNPTYTYPRPTIQKVINNTNNASSFSVRGSVGDVGKTITQGQSLTLSSNGVIVTELGSLPSLVASDILDFADEVNELIAASPNSGGGGDSSYDLHFRSDGKPLASEVLGMVIAVRDFTIASAFAGSDAYATNTATSNTTFNVQRGARDNANEFIWTTIGTILFAPSSRVPIFSLSTDITVLDGQALRVVAPNVQDATLSDVVGIIKTNTGSFVIPASPDSDITTYFPLDIPPQTPSVWDDEFEINVLDAKWTQISTACPTTSSIENGFCVFEPTAASGGVGRGAFGFRQPSPTGSFVLTAKVTGNIIGSDTEIDIGVASTSNNKANLLGRYQNGQSRILGVDYSESAAWNAFDGYVPNPTGAASILPFVWLRIVWNATTSTIEFWFSQDGIRFTKITTRTAQVQPNRILMLIYSNTGGIDASQYAAYRFIRVAQF